MQAMLKDNMFIVTPKTKLLSSKHSYEVRNEGGQVLATAEQSTGFLDQLLGMVKGPPSTKIEFRTKPDNALAFAIRRKGFLFKKVEAVDDKGEVIGRYKAKSFSLSGGYHVYDKDGKHIAEIRGKLLKSEYTVFTPDGKTEMGKVSKKWGGMIKSLLTSDGTYGVQIGPQFAEDEKTKMVILGAAIAIDCLMSKHGAAKGKEGGESDGGGEE
jgi:uncharacterized protein YxjI